MQSDWLVWVTPLVLPKAMMAAGMETCWAGWGGGGGLCEEVETKQDVLDPVRREKWGGVESACTSPPRCTCMRMPGTERRLLRVGGRGGLQCHQALRQCGENGVVMLKILKEKNVIIIPIGHKKPLKI